MDETESRPRRDRSDVVGLVPMAGRGQRLGPLPGSKEMLPLLADATGGVRPVACYLLEEMAAAGIRRALLVLRAGKWDIPAFFADGAAVGLDLAYLVTADSGSIPETLDRARPFLQHARVAMGFPDVLFTPAGALARLLDRQEASGADVVLGLFPTDRPQKADMVELDASGRILGFAVKPRRTRLRYTWLLAAWTPAFTGYLHHRLTATGGGEADRELYPSDVLAAALADGLPLEGVCFPEGSHLDIGTPEDLGRAMRRQWCRE